jgi:hypothetical protein
MDRGIATKDNLALLKEKGYPYLLIERRNAEKEYVREFEHARENFEVIKDDKNKDKVKVYVNPTFGNKAIEPLIRLDSLNPIGHYNLLHLIPIQHVFV